ncbi:DUF2975 domain-containing protein [Streptomyces sp. XM4193]|uniref:DUF2975 domain-containing protein n=1 Tax=Streptomyces sp. XM4193 TaxID=2929782 RepID=UPI001FFA8B49|nr:DUF2975 domain-containing protein [Streptomyces sp. XM4193]MCK1798630.1 DUF2975 domain-containing protein [Streptomyces sp. XM4193]
MNTRMTRVLASLTYGLAVLCGVAFAGAALMRIGDDGDICTETTFWQNASMTGGLPIGEGVTASGSATRLCQSSPSVAQRAADLGNVLPWLLIGCLALLLFSRLLKDVVEQGPFTEAVSRRLTVLGWLVALGTPVAGLTVGWSQSWLVGSMVPVITDTGPELSGPMILVLAGLAAVIMGRIMREGTRMREDLEGTV